MNGEIMKTITILCGLLLSISAFSSTLKVSQARSLYAPECESLQDLNNERYQLSNIQFSSEDQGIAQLTFDVQFSKCLVTDEGLRFVDYDAYENREHQYLNFETNTFESFEEQNVRVEFYAVQNETKLLDKITFGSKKASLSINVQDVLKLSENSDIQFDIYPHTVKKSFYNDGTSEVTGSGVWNTIRLDIESK